MIDQEIHSVLLQQNTKLTIQFIQFKIQFNTFRQGFASTTTFLKRRFSSGDLQGESYEEQENKIPEDNKVPSGLHQSPSLVDNVGIKGNNTSAPASPRGVTGLLSRATSLTGSVTNTVQQQIARATSQVAAVIKDRHKILLIIDNHLVDWSKYFRGRRLIGDWDIKIEQAEFKDINLSANSELGAVVSIHTVDRNGFKIARTFRPDFVLIRQHIQDSNRNYSDIIVGLKYGLVPSINSLQSFYNLQDKAWVFANLLSIQRKYGKENFPLIEQTYYQNYRDSAGVPKFPCVVKIGSSSSGLGKVKVDNINNYQDVRSILMITDKYCIIEPYIDAKYDFCVQKIGANYKVFTRKSVSGNWKANVGSSLLEQIGINDRYKKWIDDVSDSFGGLDICSLEGVIGNDGNEYIFKVRGSDMTLLGENQEEDRKNIVELIVQKMNVICKNVLIKQQSRPSISMAESTNEQNEPLVHQLGKRLSLTSTSINQPNPPARKDLKESSVQQARGPPPPIPQNKPPVPSPIPQKPPGASQVPKVPPPKPPLPSQNSLSSNSKATANKTINENSTNPFISSFSPPTSIDDPSQNPPTKPTLTKRDSQSAIDDIKEEVDDTMRNLRKTFAGIFGDM